MIQGAEKPPQDITPLIQVLLGITAPSAPASIGDIAFFDPSLNQSQKGAVRFALAAPEVACIHGPPGTPSSLPHHFRPRSRMQAPARRTRSLRSSAN